MLDFFFFINSVFWGLVMIYLFFGVGCWFIFCIGFVQFCYICQFGKSFKNSIYLQLGGLILFQLLCISFVVCVGSGNLVGVVLVIIVGGFGVVFWMWVVVFIGMVILFVECFFVQFYKECDVNGQFCGGLVWYMVCGLGMCWMGVLFVVFLFIVYGIIFSGIQVNVVV